MAHELVVKDGVKDTAGNLAAVFGGTPPTAGQGLAWNVSNLRFEAVTLSGVASFDAIVAAGGGGTHTTLYDAVTTAGVKSIFVKDGETTEVNDITFSLTDMLIYGESRAAKINMGAHKLITSNNCIMSNLTLKSSYVGTANVPCVRLVGANKNIFYNVQFESTHASDPGVIVPFISDQGVNVPYTNFFGCDFVSVFDSANLIFIFMDHSYNSTLMRDCILNSVHSSPAYTLHFDSTTVFLDHVGIVGGQHSIQFDNGIKGITVSNCGLAEDNYIAKFQNIDFNSVNTGNLTINNLNTQSLTIKGAGGFYVADAHVYLDLHTYCRCMITNSLIGGYLHLDAGSDGTQISNSQFSDFSDAGTTNIQVSNCRIGIGASGRRSNSLSSARWMISNCFIQPGITVNSSNTVVTGNVLDGPIYVVGDKNVITGNRIYGSLEGVLTACVQTDAGADSTIIVGNSTYDPTINNGSNTKPSTPATFADVNIVIP